MCNRNKFSNFFFLSSNKIKTQVQLGRKSWGQWWYVLSEMLHHQYLELRVKYYVKKKNTWKSMTTQKSSDLREKKLEKDITFISLILAHIHTYLFFPHIHIYTRVSYDKVSI